MANSIEEQGPAVALYHRVYENEGFEEAARGLWGILRLAVEQYPGRARLLYLDIDGHQNSAGGFDHDMYELQTHFVLGHLMQFLTEAHVPLAHVRNPGQQSDEVPEELHIHAEQAEGGSG
jgi:hypothetical protein